jgi:transcriptional regulator with XRE-family HTH domain
MNIGATIIELRKGQGWSQTDLGKKVNVSREIIGRYERNDAIPSVEIAKRIADAFDVTLDYLAGSNEFATFDKKTVELIQEIEKLEPETKEKLLYLANAVIRDYKAKQAYRT